MSKTRIMFEDRDGKGSTAAWVVWSHNHLNQRRQFATDGVRYFYQPDKRSAFMVVNEADFPAAAREALDRARREG